MKRLLQKSIFLCMLSGLLWSSCSNAKGKIDGKWVLKKASGTSVNDPNNYLILKSDGSAIENNGAGENAKTWTIHDDELCIKALDSDGGIETCGEYSLNGDVLKMELSALGVELEYQRQAP